MLFNSPVFLLAFLPFALLAYYGSRRFGLGKPALTAISLLFYGYWDPRLLPLLLCSVLATWLVVGAAFRFRGRGAWTAFGIIANLLLLGIFKYANFFSGAFADLGIVDRHRWDIVLPLAISFFTFHQISYLIDVQRGEQRFYSLPDYLLYVVFFPHLIAGPIVRHNEFMPQIAAMRERPIALASVGIGTVLFIIGLVKKTWLADPLAGIVDPLFAEAHHAMLDPRSALLATASFSLQIYFDFSGYTDMAIGLSLMLGYVLPQNFNAPYTSASLIDFWRRWHMTLSRYLRDYLYIPLGGNRHGVFRRDLALLATMTLGGLWHGANWTFVAWGGLHGLGLVVNHHWRRLNVALPLIIARFFTVAFVMLCFVVFRADNISHAVNVVAPLTGLVNATWSLDRAAALVLAAAAVSVIGPTSQALAGMRVMRHASSAMVLAIVFVAALLWIVQQERYAPFIYFQF